MRRSSFQRPKGILENKGTLGALIVLAAVLVLASIRYIAPDAFTSLSLPLLSLGRTGTEGAAMLSGGLESKESLHARIEALEEENADLRITNETLSSRINDIEALGSFPEAGRTYALAGVLSGPPLSPYDTLLVEGGAKDAIQTGARAYGTGGVPVGTVASVSFRTSRVLLYSSPGEETTGWFGEERTPIVLLGKGAGAFSATLPRDVPIVSGESVYLPGPGAIPVGSVGAVHEDPASPEKRIDILPRVSPFSLTWLLIEKEDAP